MTEKQTNPANKGFTLAELLIALSILGVIATFSIPKVLQAQQDSKFRAIGKETVAMISEAFQQFRIKNPVTAATEFQDLTPYMNYVKVDLTSQIDSAQGLGAVGCGDPNGDGNPYICLQLHNGAKLLYPTGEVFNGTSKLHALYAYLDPDGKYAVRAPEQANRWLFFLYTTGKVVNYGDLLSGTISHYTVYGPDPSKDPPWFGWN